MYRYEFQSGVPVLPVYLSRAQAEADPLNFINKLEPPRPSFYAVSSAIDNAPIPKAISNATRTGHWQYEDVVTDSDIAVGGKYHNLNAFLNGGPPPVVLGWGSMIPEGMKPHEMLHLSIQTVRHANCRAIVLGGWAKLDELAKDLIEEPPEGGKGSRSSGSAAIAKNRMFFISYVPHTWLFPRCTCIVHHGGVGTTYEAIMACKPQVITPICADQFQHAKMVQTTGVGLGLPVLSKVSSEQLAQAIRSAQTSAAPVAANAIAMRVRDSERGAEVAAEEIGKFISQKVRTGQWRRAFKKTQDAKKAKSAAPPPRLGSK